MHDIPKAIFLLDEAFRREGFEIRAAGGCVRDRLLGVEPKDWDICTTATPDDMLRIGENAGLRVEPTGIDHGTVSFIIDGVPYETTTLRIDRECDGRHADVEFTNDWSLDAQRRDLTINALMMDMDGQIHDHVGGRKDIEERRLRFVGEPEARVQEDHLRMLRYFRFANKFTTSRPQLDEASLEAISTHAPRIDTVSRERIWSELRGILSGTPAIELLPVIAESGLAKGCGLPLPDPAAALEAAKRGCGPLAVLSTQMRDPVEAAEISAAMKMSKSERAELALYTRERNRDGAGIKRCMDLIVDGTERNFVVNLAKLRGDDTHAVATFEAPAFPVSGDDLLKAGYRPGPILGKKLGEVRNVWKASGYTLGKEELLAPPPARPARPRDPDIR